MIEVDPARADRVLDVDALASQSKPEGASADGSGVTPKDGEDLSPKPSVAAAVTKMISALALVIVAVYGGLYLLRRMMGRRYGGAHGINTLEVLQTTYVGQHKAISLVKVGKRSVLVGVTDNQISTLTELDAEETDEILGESAPANTNESFSRVFTSAAEKLKMLRLKKKQAALET
ncbi:MAG: flagellar biosynthetic protein FliO [Candidatus Zixiibacteriota bacterium]